MHTFLDAAMAELADALDLGSSGETRAGSIPVSRTKMNEIPPFSWRDFLLPINKLYRVIQYNYQ